MTKKRSTMLVLGNPLEDIDKLPVQLLPALITEFPTIDFLLFDPTEELPPSFSSHLYILDTVVGIDHVTVFDSFESFALSPRITVHDYDLPLFLGMLKKLGKLNTVTIIGVPPKGGQRKKEIVNTIMKLLQSHAKNR